jgi:hypothetical protein
MREFDLEKALAGHPVVTRSGMEVTGLHRFNDANTKMNVIGVSLGVLYQWNEKGKLLSDGDSAYDLFMDVFKTKYIMFTATKRGVFDPYVSGLYVNNLGHIIAMEADMACMRKKGYDNFQTHEIEREE